MQFEKTHTETEINSSLFGKQTDRNTNKKSFKGDCSKASHFSPHFRSPFLFFFSWRKEKTCVRILSDKKKKPNKGLFQWSELRLSAAHSTTSVIVTAVIRLFVLLLFGSYNFHVMPYLFADTTIGFRFLG